MRLLNVHSLKVQEFNDDRTKPLYAILSHTWEEGEISLQDMQKASHAKSMAGPGYTKVRKCCEIAKRDGFEYVWIDTCCIDKTSSAELSEAINSMFAWYRAADVCYVYLSDVTGNDSEDHTSSTSTFRTSRWFTRGWTLQELLAPEVAVFYDKDWVNIGSKRTLQKAISEITAIPREVLLDANRIRGVSIAARMSWASHRHTTRVEDRAYSLMGIFDVHMPPLYGEGVKAFRRLQLEIIKESRDESVFAWSPSPHQAWTTGTHRIYTDSEDCDLLASSPQYFSHCHGVLCSDRYQSIPPFSISNKGLHIWLPSIRSKDRNGNNVLLSGLNCTLADGKQIFIALDLRSDSGEYARRNSTVFTVTERGDLDTMGSPMEVYIVGQDSSSRKALPSRYFTNSIITSVFHLEENTSPKTGYHIDSFFYAGKRCRGSNVPHNRTFVFNEHGYHLDNLDLLYFVVTWIQDPSIRATIALAAVRSSPTPELQTRVYFSENTYHCRIFSGPKVHLSNAFFIDWRSQEQRKLLFAEMFSSDNNRFEYFPSDKIVRRLPGSYVYITMSARTGPMAPYLDDFGMWGRSDHHYHIDIAFSRVPPASSEILDADIILDK